MTLQIPTVIKRIRETMNNFMQQFYLEVPQFFETPNYRIQAR